MFTDKIKTEVYRFIDKVYMGANEVQPIVSGTTAQRPDLTTVPIGYSFFDTSIGKNIYKRDSTSWAITKTEKIATPTNYTFVMDDNGKYIRATGTSNSGTFVINKDIFIDKDSELEGELEFGQKTFVAGEDVTLRFPEGQGLIAPTGSRFIVKFKSPNDALVTIIKPYTTTEILSTTATLDFPTISAGETERLTATVTGAALLDPVLVAGPDNIYNSNDSTIDAWVSAANTVTVRVRNNGASSIDPGEGQFKIRVFK